MPYKSNMELNFRRIFVQYGILRSSDYSNTKTYLKILQPTARGVVVKQHLIHASRKKTEGLKHNFYS